MALENYYDETLTVNSKTYTVNVSSRIKTSTTALRGTVLAHRRQKPLTEQEYTAFGLNVSNSEALMFWTFPDAEVYRDDEIVDSDGNKFDVVALRLVKRGITPHHKKLILLPQKKAQS